jgi:hypothetical protein
MSGGNEHNIEHARSVIEGRRIDVDSVLIIRAVAGVLFVVVLGILIQRRRTSVQ